MSPTTTLSRLAAAVLAVVLAATTATPSVAVPADVASAYDPTVLRDYTLTMQPLAGYVVPVDHVYPDGYETWSAEDQQAYVDDLARAAAWDVVRFDTTTTIVLPAMFASGGETPILVGVRRKSSRALPSEADPHKVGLKVSINEYVSSQRWHGVTKLSLENGGDVSPVAEGLAWQLHQRAAGTGLYPIGYDPALSAWATVSVNGENLGVYTSVEQRNKQFLKNRNLWTTSSPVTWMYKADDIGAYLLDEGPSPLPDGTVVNSPTYDALCFRPFRPTPTCATPSDQELATLLPSLIDMDVLLTEAAVDAYTVNNDAVMSKGKNHFFVDREGELRRYYPWDLDAVFGKSDGTSTGTQIYAVGTSVVKRKTVYTQSAYQEVLLNHPTFRAQYNRIMLALLDGPLSVSALHAVIDAAQTTLSPALAADPYVGAVLGGGSVADHFASLRAWITSRDAAVRAQVSANLPAPRPTWVTQAPTSLAYGGATTVKAGGSYTLSAALVSNGSPVPGRTVTFVVNKVTYTATTTDLGVASVTAKAAAKTGAYTVAVRYAGETAYAPATASASLTVTK